MTFFCCAVSIARPFSRELGTFRAEKRERDREGETIEEQKSPLSSVGSECKWEMGEEKREEESVEGGNVSE